MKIIVGDIHACRTELEELLDKIGPGSDDKIIALGDIFDRGPDNRGMLRLFTENSQFSTIKGNHENKHLLIKQKKCRPAISQLITKEELGEDYPALLDFARTLPTFIELDEVILVHGSIEPGVPLEQQKEVVLLSSISGEKYLKKFAKPWYELIDLEKPIIFGHRVHEKAFIFQDKVYGIDTGCCIGGNLTAITIPDFKIYSIKAKKDYWHNAKEDYKPRLPEKPKKIKKPKHPGLDIEKTYKNIIDLADKLKEETGSRKEYAREVEKRGLTHLLFRAYDGKLTQEDIARKADISKIESLAEYK